MTQEEIIKSVLKYLYFRTLTTSNGYEWREACGLIEVLEEHFNVDYSEEFYSQFTVPAEDNMSTPDAMQF